MLKNKKPSGLLNNGNDHMSIIICTLLKQK